jgi:hypothetical protein
MAYDDHQWALLPLLKASMLVFMILVATMFMRFRYRVAVYVGMLLYYHQDAAKDTGTNYISPVSLHIFMANTMLTRSSND